MSVIGYDLFFELFGSGEAPGARGQIYSTPADRPALLALARTMRSRTVIEFGVQEGRTAALLLRECPWIERYVGIDVPADFAPALVIQLPEVPQIAGHRAAGDGRFELLIAEGGSRTLSPSDLPDRVDLVYIDGSHAEADVRHDTALARAAMPLGGVIVWHDYPSCIGVQRVIDQLNDAEGDHIALIEGTWICFELFRGNACGALGSSLPSDPTGMAAVAGRAEYSPDATAPVAGAAQQESGVPPSGGLAPQASSRLQDRPAEPFGGGVPCA